MTNTPTAAVDLTGRLAETDMHAIRAGAVECAALLDRAKLYRNLTADGPTVAELADVPADRFTATGWRMAAVVALAEADPHETGNPDRDLVELAAEFRRRALECSHQSRDLDPGSAGYLMTIWPRRLELGDDSVVIRCGIPTDKHGQPCAWAAARTLEAAAQAHEDYARHVIHDHSTTAGKVGVDTPGEPF